MSTDITIASTTDSPAQIKAAMAHGTGIAAEDLELEAEAEEGGTPEPTESSEKTTGVKLEQAKAEKIEAAASEAKAAAKIAVKSEPKARPQRPKREEYATQEAFDEALGEFVATRRIAKLTWEREEERRQREAVEARLADLEKRLPLKAEATTIQPAAQIATTPKPKAENFETHEEWIEALVDWRDEQRQATSARVAEETAKRIVEENRKKDAEAADADAAADALDSFRSSIHEARARHDDFDEAMREASTMPVTEAMRHVLFRASEDPEVPGLAHEVSYYLWTHPDEAKAIVDLQPAEQLEAMTELRVQVKHELLADAEPRHEPDASTQAVAAKKPAPKAVTRTGEPITPVGARAAASVVDLSKVDQREFNRIRNEQERARRRLR